MLSTMLNSISINSILYSVINITRRSGGRRVAPLDKPTNGAWSGHFLIDPYFNFDALFCRTADSVEMDLSCNSSTFPPFMRYSYLQSSRRPSGGYLNYLYFQSFNLSLKSCGNTANACTEIIPGK